MSIAKLKKSVVQSAAKRLNCPAGGPHGAHLKSQYDLHFRPGRLYMEKDGRCYLPDQPEQQQPEQLNRPLQPPPMAPIGQFFEGRFPGRKLG